MRHVFIINPVAGRRDESESLREEIESTCHKYSIDPLIFLSEYPGYEKEMTEKICNLFPSDSVRFYAVGGSGTLCSVVSGIQDYHNTEVACYPSGLTNDLLKMYGKTAGLFSNIENLISGRTDYLDMIDVDGFRAVNFVNYGIGSRYFNDVSTFKLGAMVSPQLTYTLSVLFDVISNTAQEYKILIDGVDYSGKYDIIMVMNGQCLGGNIYPLHDPRPNDGMLEFVLATRSTIIGRAKALLDFRKTRLGSGKKDIKLVRGRCADIRLADGSKQILNCDGEGVMVDGSKICVAPEKLRFVVPRDARLIPPTSMERYEQHI